MLASSWQSKIYPAKFIPVNKYGFYDKHACDINIKSSPLGVPTSLTQCSVVVHYLPSTDNLGTWKPLAA